MISCIICSRSSDISEELKKNIANTIGEEYELIIIDNSKNIYSIFSAYNEGVRRSKGDILCFMHEDIIYHADDWGIKIEKYFEDITIGLIGVCGSHFLSRAPIGWWKMAPFTSYSYIQNGTESQEISLFKGDDDLIDAVVCDGLCLFIRSSLFDKICFDEKNYDGFHFYDMDICMQVIQKGYRVCILKEILLEHFSTGNMNKKWNDNLCVFYKKWNYCLPIYKGIDFPQKVLDHFENLLLHNYYDDILIDKLEKEKCNIQNSRAYKIGKVITRYFRFFFNIFIRK